MSKKRGYQGRYSASEKSKFPWWILLAAALILAAVAAWFLNKEPGQPKQETIAATTPVTTASLETAETVEENPYREILEQYVTAIEEKWTAEQLAPTDLGPKIAHYNGYDGLGYSLMDLNEDGSEELIITDGSAIYALYTIVDGKVQPQWLGFENMECWLCEDNVLMEVNEGMGWNYVFMKLGETVLEPFETMTYAPEKDADNPWFQGNPYIDPDTMSLDGGEAVARLQSYEKIYIRNTPFRLGIDGGAEEDYVPENSEIYLPAIQEVQKNYIFAEPMTYTFYDFDEDGDEEFLLGSGNAIRYVLKVQDGQVRKIWESANESYVYLCDGGILWDVSLRGNWFTDMDGNVVEFVYHRDETDSWYMKNKEKSPDVPIDEAQAKEILASFQRTALGWRPIEDFPADIGLEKKQEPDQLSIYRQALEEKWDLEQCSAAGISYMVGFFQDRPTQIGYAWLDLDGGGEELLITDGRNILDLYSVEDGTATLVFSGGERYAYTLMEDKRIFFQGSGSASTSYYTLYRMEGSELIEEESYIFDGAADPENTWFFSVDGGSQPCGDFDAEARIAELTAADIPFTPFF